MSGIKLIFAATTILLLQAQAQAGLSDEHNTLVAVSGGMAHGGFRASRSASETAFISCSVDPSQSARTVNCKAKDARGAYTYCNAPNAPAVWIEMVSGISDLSYVSFFGDSQHLCRSISVQQGSQFR